MSDESRISRGLVSKRYYVAGAKKEKRKSCRLLMRGTGVCLLINGMLRREQGGQAINNQLFRRTMIFDQKNVSSENLNIRLRWLLNLILGVLLGVCKNFMLYKYSYIHMLTQSVG